MKSQTVSRVFKDIQEERERQEKKWGTQNHKPEIWLTILAEEFGEVSKEVCDFYFLTDKTHRADVPRWLMLKRLRDELVQTCAVGVAMLESLDRNELK